MKIRRVGYQNGTYQLLKPKEGGWHEYGVRKRIKALDDAIISGEYDLILSKNIREDLEEFRKMRVQRKLEYLKRGF